MVVLKGRHKSWPTSSTVYIKESMRLFPPLWTAVGQRLAEEKNKLDRNMLFGGTWVYVHFYSIHHQPEIWKNPEVLLLNECYIIHWKLSEKYALWVTWSCWAPMAAWFLYFPIKCMYIVAHYRIDYTCMRDPKAATPMLLCHSLLVQGNNSQPSNVFHTIPCTLCIHIQCILCYPNIFGLEVV